MGVVILAYRSYRKGDPGGGFSLIGFFGGRIDPEEQEAKLLKQDALKAEIVALAAALRFILSGRYTCPLSVHVDCMAAISAAQGHTSRTDTDHIFAALPDQLTDLNFQQL